MFSFVTRLAASVAALLMGLIVTASSAFADPAPLPGADGQTGDATSNGVTNFVTLDGSDIFGMSWQVAVGLGAAALAIVLLATVMVHNRHLHAGMPA
ncbi:hypothetical protein [Janibacter sp. G1551]|uniref:hypothetical protein n=1 Tax=Janibacter sp. G1551 TaxID=3420440 RepID=UPI003D00FDBF